MNGDRRRRRRIGLGFRSIVAVLTIALAGLAVASAFAANINGTAKNDTLRGGPKADKIFGRAGNDKLYGMGGADLLNGGPGNDRLVGGPGADVLVCGPGADTATADAQDKVRADCETVTGLPKPAASVGAVTLAEGNAGTSTMGFTVTLAKATPQKVTLAYTTSDVTATAGTDYTATSGTLAFAAGETSRTIAVPIVGDTVFEPDETFTLTLSNLVNAVPGQATATGTTKNDDVSKPKAGRYGGTTSQGKTFAFDLNADSTGITAIDTVVDLTCQEVPVVFRDIPLNLGGLAPLTGDYKFTVNATDTDAQGSLVIAITGALAVGAPASGTLRVDFTVNTSSGPVHCSTGALTWNATPPA
jgi:hypothetical protein